MADAPGPVDVNRFEKAYASAGAPWDIGRPQEALVAVEARGEVAGRVLDVGCGSGENALFLAGKGYEVVGIDLSRHAVRIAQEKAQTRSTDVAFHLMDALAMEPGALGGRFDTIIDSGVFHVFSDEERTRYVKALGRVARPGARLHVFVFSDEEPTDWGGPRRITQDELYQAFWHGWEVLAIEPTRYETVLDVTGHAWHGAFRRLD